MAFPDLPGLPLLFRLRGIGVDHPQEPVNRPYGYPQFQWIQVKTGTLEVTASGNTETARPGDGFFLRPHEPHRYFSPDPGGAVVDWMAFDGEGIEDSLAGGPLTRSGVYRLTGATAADPVFRKTWNGVSVPGTPAVRLSACVYELLMVLSEVAAEIGARSVASGLGRLEPVLQAMAHRPGYPWTPKELGALVGVSPQHLGRLFRLAVGQAPSAYLARLRLNRALQLLSERPDLRIHEVGAAVGYPDTNYFVRLFRRSEGRTPGQFRDLQMGNLS